MPSGSRYANFALGLVVGLGIALLFLVWAVPEFSSPAGHVIEQTANQQSGPGDSQGAANDKQADEPGWRTWTKRLVAAEDTLAQWVMALFTVTATGVSLVAVVLLRDTLRETRRIGQAQVRAYLQFRPHTLQYVRSKKGASGDGIKVIGKLANRGQSTALNVEIGGMVTLSKPDIGGALDKRIVMSPAIASLAPGTDDQDVSVAIPFATFINDRGTNDQVWCLVAIRYIDVFDDPGSADFRARILNASQEPTTSRGLIDVAASGSLFFSSG